MLLKQRHFSVPRFASVMGSHSIKQLPEPACTSADNGWVGSLNLKRVIRPDFELQRHRDTSLRISIHESKNLPPKRRYFCDVCLDRKLYARTTSKLSSDGVFWGECFDLNNLTELNYITINLYCQTDSTKNPSKRRKPSKWQNQLVAFLTIAISDLSSKYETQQWHTMTPASMAPSTENLLSDSAPSRSSIHQPTGSFSNPSNGSSGTTAVRSFSLVGPPPTSLLTGRMRKFSKQSLSSSETRMNASMGSGSNGTRFPQIRLAVKYQSIDVLPLHCYDDLRKFVVERSVEFVQYLEPLLPTKRKEDIARCLVHIHEKASEGSISTFLARLVDRELNSFVDNLSLLFRSNSIGSKAIECYIKLVGAEYLQKLLRGLIEGILMSNEDFEVDPSGLTKQPWLPVTDHNTPDVVAEVDANRLLRNQTALTNSIKLVWKRLQASLIYFPGDLSMTLASIRRIVEQRHGQDVGDQLVSGCLFLRCICPAIYCPTLFGLTNTIPDDPRVSRNLTLLAKVLQTIANFSHFEEKENYMRFMNSFVQSMQHEMHQFLRAVSTIDEDVNSGMRDKQQMNVSSCHSNIDLAYELTVLYHHLMPIIEEDWKISNNLAEITDILMAIKHTFSKPSLPRSLSKTNSLDDKGANHEASLCCNRISNVPSLGGLQITPSDNISSAAPLHTDVTPICASSSSSGDQQRCCIDLNSPSSEGMLHKQAFFGDFQENDKATNSSVTGIARHRPVSTTQSPNLPQSSASLNRYKQIKCRDIDNNDRGFTDSSLQKWSSGLELHADSSVALNFPPPPCALPQQQKDGRYGGSSSNIRMGTRAIRMSREGDLTGNPEAEASTRSGEDGPTNIQLCNVPVILQCETRHVDGSRSMAVAVGGRVRGSKDGDGSVASADSAASLESSSASSSSCLSMMPHVNNFPGVNVNGSSNRSLVPENVDYFISSKANNDPALLSRIHRLLFGGDSDYQNVTRLARTTLLDAPMSKTEDRIDENSKQTESFQLNALQQRLRAMEEHLNQERKDMQKAVASNMRMMARQERCINQLIEDINRLKNNRDTPNSPTTNLLLSKASALTEATSNHSD